MKGRLWIVARSLPAHIAGGMERVAFDTSAGLARRGWSVDLVTTRLEGEAGLPPEVRVHALDAPPGVHSARFRRALAAWARSRPEPDLVLSISFAAGPILRRRPSLPSICQAHGSAWREAALKIRAFDPRGLYRLWLHLTEERRAFAACDRIAAVGPAVRAYLASFPYGPAFARKTVVLPNGIDVESCARAAAKERGEIRGKLGVAPGERLIVSACRLIPEKGVFDLVRAYAGMESRDRTTLLIAGSGRDEGRIRRFVAAKDLRRVRMVGTVPREEVLDVMHAADLVVQIGVRPEGLPLVVLEALALGCPVLVSDRAVLPDFGEERGAVIRTDPIDRAAIARALEHGIDLGGPFPDIARAARDRFSIETMISGYESLIEEVIRERRAARLPG